MAESGLPDVWQAEWCPHSRKVRSALTELGIAFVARQVPADPDDRDDLEREVGSREIPVVRLADGTVLDGDDHEIVAALRERFDEPPGAEQHREKAREKSDAGD
jgi:glutathione S-transferase